MKRMPLKVCYEKIFGLTQLPIFFIVLALFGTIAVQNFFAQFRFPGQNAKSWQSVGASKAKSGNFKSEAKNSQPVEILLASEQENSFIDGDKRISVETGFPRAIYQSDFRVSSDTPEKQAREYLFANQKMLGLNAVDIENLRLHIVREDETGSIVRLRQTWKNLPVNRNAEITVHINRNKIVDFVMNGFEYGVKIEDVKPEVSTAEAYNAVLSQLNSSKESINEQKSELMILHHQDTDYLVYRLNFLSEDYVGEWEAFIDADTGRILKLEDVAYYHRNKQSQRKTDSLLVNGTGNVFDPDPLTTALSAYTGGYVDGTDANTPELNAQLKSVTLPDITLSGGNYSLVGPYAEILDFEAPNKGLFQQTSSTFNFDRSADAFEAVNTYYHIDAAMRYLNETLSLNIKPYQYTTGVRFDPSGLSGSDNSHYLSGSGRLAFGEGGVDDAEDADVIIHELGHGLHDWATSGGLSQVNGLSEGTGDYIAGSYSRFKGFWNSSQPAYHWTFNWDGHNPFWNGRILNYSSTYPGGLTGSIHTDGQIWATVNMKIWDDIGRQQSDKAFWSGLKLTNSSTNQNDAANAIMTAATNLGYTFAERTAMRNRYVAAGYTIPTITAANVSVSGKVKRISGRGIANVTLTLTDASGQSRSTQTNSFGYYRFTNVVSGNTYILSASSKRFQFASQTVSVSADVADLDITANN